MTGFVQEHRDLLEAWEAQYRGRPDRELQRLLLLALEREQLVAVAYRSEILAGRLAQLDVPEPVLAAFTQALAWAWRDEQQHTVFTRGILLSSPRLLTRLQAWAQVIGGAVAGWAAATLHHASWRRAPIARAFAGLATLAGRIAGKVPRSMRRRLHHMSFAEYCRLQCDAEAGAALCWERIAVVGRAVQDVDDATARAFEQMWRHEEDHREAFEVLAGAVTDEGALAPGRDARAVVSAIGRIGPMFLPRSARRSDHPVGSGGVVHVEHGSGTGAAALNQALERGGLYEVLTEAGRPLSKLRVMIKPTFMLAYDRRDRAVFTDPRLVDALVAWLRARGVTQIAVGEAPNLYGRFYGGRSVHEVAEYIGMQGDYDVVDLTREVDEHDYAYGLGPTKISTEWRDADVRIAFPKLRSHPVDFAHLCLGGLEGIAGRIDPYLFSERRADRATATMMPLVDHPPHFGVIDGWDSAADGLVGMIACRDPPQPRRIWAGRDVLAVDLVAMRHLGLVDLRDADVMSTGTTWFGDPRAAVRVTGNDSKLEGWRHPFATSLSALLAFAAYPVYQHAGGRGSVFTPPMDPEAFPPLHDESWILRARRASVRALLKMGPPAISSTIDHDGPSVG